MSDQNDRLWYIDAWSVIDGYAFASLRSPDSLDAEVTFFVGPPYFEPEPIASLATALAATRGGMQAGFRVEGAEVAFFSLQQIVETVRRAFRAGGLDIDGTPGAPAAPRPRETPGGIHPGELVDGDMQAIWQELRGAMLDDFGSESRVGAIASRVAALTETAFARLIPKFVGAAAFEMLAGIAEGSSLRSEAVRELGAWTDKARQIGVHIHLSPDSLDAAAMGSTMGFAWKVQDLPPLPEYYFEFAHSFYYRTVGSPLPDVRIPYRVPIPAVFQLETGKARYPPIPTLGHLVAVASADRDYVRAVGNVHEFVPLLVASLMQLPSAALSYVGVSRGRRSLELRDMTARAGQWLARTLPTGLLHKHPAERAIHDLVVQLLTRSGDDQDEQMAAAMAR
jgi:hypothetical protein